MKRKYRVEYAIEAEWPDVREAIVEAENELDAAQEIRMWYRSSRDVDIYDVKELYGGETDDA